MIEIDKTFCIFFIVLNQRDGKVEALSIFISHNKFWIRVVVGCLACLQLVLNQSNDKLQDLSSIISCNEFQTGVLLEHNIRIK